MQVIGYGFYQPDNMGRYSQNLRILRGSNLKVNIDGLEFDVEFEGQRESLKANVTSRFNASNLLAVLAIMLANGVDFHKASHALSQVKPIAGRMEKFGGGEQPVVIIDYAHTPDALEKVLRGLRETVYNSQARNKFSLRKPRLICVFGCGGDRDRGKRPLAGEITTKLADEVIITSDNPRSEDPRAIIDQIVTGISRHNYSIEEDRTSAIYQAIHNARKGDVVLIAGKGSEAYQEINGQKNPFDDREIAQQVLDDLANLKVQAQR